MGRELLIVGVNHHTAPLELRERLALTNGAMEHLLDDLVKTTEVQEAVALSTCNRVELVACCKGREADAVLLDELFRPSGIEASDHASRVFRLYGREAVRHLFRVASSLDSLVVGEPQILGQMKEQFALSAETEAVGPVLHRIFHKSFAVAKRVRSETAIASRAVSVASAATDLARTIFETLAGRTIMLVGAGEIGEVAARHFLSGGAAQIMVANRTFETAVELARTLRGTPVPFERIANYLPLADLVVGASAGGQLLETTEVRRVLKERLNRPVFFIDLAVPRNFDPAINEIDNAYLYNMDDLGAVVEENRGERQREAVRAEAIVEQEVETFWQWFEKLEVVPTIVELRNYAEALRAAELERTLPKLAGLSEADRERVERMTRAMINKILHEPTVVLKRDRSPVEEFVLLSAVRELFGLEKKR